MTISTRWRATRIAAAAAVAVVALAGVAAIADPGHGPGGGYGYRGMPMAPYGQMPMAPYGQTPMAPYGQTPMGPYGQMPMGPYGGMPMGPGMMMGPGGRYGGWQGGYAPRGEVKEADIRRLLERRLEWQGLKRLKVGKIQTGEKRITADVVTKEGALIQRYRFDRQNGRLLEID